MFRDAKPLTLASYCAKALVPAYVEPMPVGHELPDMPLLLTPGHYVNVPLEATCMAVFRGVRSWWICPRTPAQHKIKERARQGENWHGHRH